MKCFHLLLFTGIIIPLFAANAGAENFEQRHARVCAGDYREKVNVDTDVLQVLVKMKDYINQVAAKFGTDPNVIAGAILTEHSLNTGAKDIAENFLVKIGATPTGEIFGKKFTYGFGQLHFERASTAEQIAASVEHRPVRNRQEINNAIESPEGSIEYIGALLKQEQDSYKAAGYDISKDPGVLATLYNIGKLDQRIQRTKAEKRLPEPNYFGCYVEHNLALIQKSIASAHKVRVVSEGPAPAPAPNAKVVLAAKAFNPKDAIDLFQMKKDTLLSNGPSACYDEPTFATNNKTIKRGDTIHILNKSVDCDLNPWIMVQNQDGVVGWVDKKALSTNSEKNVGSISGDCKKVTITQKCIAYFKKEYGNFQTENEKFLSFSLKNNLPSYSAVNLKGLITDKTNTPIERDRSKMEKEWQVSDADFKNLLVEIPAAIKEISALLEKEQHFPTIINPPISVLYRSNTDMLNRILSVLQNGISPNDATYYFDIPLAQKIVVALKDPKVSAQQLFDIINNEVNSFEDSAARHSIRGFDKFLKVGYDVKLPSSSEYAQVTEALDRCETVIRDTIPDSAYMLDGIRFQLFTRINDDLSGKYYWTNPDAKFWDTISSLTETCATIEMAKDPQLAKDVAAINPNCVTSLADRSAEGFLELNMQLNEALGLTKTDNDKKDFMLSALSRTYKLATEDDSALDKANDPHQFTTLRDLAGNLASEYCAKNIYVPEPWLASKNNTVYRPSDDENEIDVENSYLSCKGSSK